MKTESNFESRVKNAQTPAELRALTREMRESKPVTAPAEPAADPAAAKETDQPAEAAEPVAEGEPTGDPADPAQAAAADEPDDDADPDADGPVQPASGKRLRVRLPEGDKVGRLAAALLQRNKDMSMEEAMAKARDQLGVKSPDAPTTAAEPAKPKSDLPSTIEAVDAAIENAEAEHTKALIELRFEDAAKINSGLRRLDRHRGQLEKDGERQQVEQATAYETGFISSEAKANELYEFAGQPDSAGGKRMLEIEADLKANGDPLYNSPDKPLKIAQMVAAELNIAPRRKGAIAPAKAAAPITPAAPKKQVLPGGSSRTTVAPVNQKPAIDAEIAAVTNIHELRKVQRKFGIVL